MAIKIERSCSNCESNFVSKELKKCTKCEALKSFYLRSYDEDVTCEDKRYPLWKPHKQSVNVADNPDILCSLDRVVIEAQTAREVVEKTVEQRLQEEHFDEHYHDKVQPLEIMQEIMTPEEFRGFLFGNIIKYSCRCGKKDEPQKEFAKLRRYREWYDKAVLCEHIDPRV